MGFLCVELALLRRLMRVCAYLTIFKLEPLLGGSAALVLAAARKQTQFGGEIGLRCVQIVGHTIEHQHA